MQKIFFATFVILFAFAVPLQASASSSEKNSMKEEVAAEENKGMGGLIKLPSNPSSMFYVHVDPLVLPVIGAKGVSEIVSLIVKLEVEDQRTVERIGSIAPKLNDAYVRALYGHIDRSIYRNGRFLDVTKIKNKLTKVTEAMIGKGIVKDVLIQGVNQRQYN